jgi:hypothetical protein
LEDLEKALEGKLDKIDFQNEVARLREMIGNSVDDAKHAAIDVTAKLPTGLS